MHVLQSEERRETLRQLLPFTRAQPVDTSPRTVSLVQAFILGKRHYWNGAQRLDLQIPLDRLSISVLQNPHVRLSLVSSRRVERNRYLTARACCSSRHTCRARFTLRRTASAPRTCCVFRKSMTSQLRSG